MSEMIKEILEEEPLEEEEQEEVAVLDDASAEILLDRIRWANKQYELSKTWYEKQMEAAKEQRDRRIAYAMRDLRDYFNSIPDAAKKKAKTQISYALRNGKLLIKAQQPKYEVDDATLVPWLKSNGWPEFVKVKETADWATLKKTLEVSPDGTAMMTEDGEIVPGITVTERDPEFQVTTD